MNDRIFPAELSEIRYNANKMLGYMGIDAVNHGERKMSVQSIRSMIQDILKLTDEVQRLTKIIDDIATSTRSNDLLKSLGLTKETVMGTPVTSVPKVFFSPKIETKADCFGGKDAEPLNALMSAFFLAAGGEKYLYSYLEEAPKTSLTVELFQALNELGYTIKKI